MCSYTRGLTYSRLAAYRPRRARPRPRIGVSRGGGVVRSPGRKRKGRARARQGESIDASTAKRRKRDKESRARDARSLAVRAPTQSLHDCRKWGAVDASVGNDASNRRETRLRPAEAKASSPVAGTRASESAPFSSRVHLGRLLSAKSKERRRKRESGQTDLHMQRSPPIVALPSPLCENDDD